MVQATVSRPEIDPEIAALLNEWEQERPRALDPEALAYLALVPTWTRRLAERCSFPLRKPWDEFLAGAEAAGLVQQQPAEADDEQQADLLRFWMPEAARAGALQQVVEALHRDYLVDLAVRLGGTISGLDPDDPAVPAITRRWAEMAREVGPGRQMAEKAIVQIERQPGAADSSAAARVLFQRVTELVDRRETELADKRETGEARVWIDAGELLAAAVGGRLVDVVELAKRRVELSYREDVDRRYLTRFVERPEQLAAFHELMTGPDHLWALHYLGMGGVGKTMLLRHIGHLAPGDAYHSRWRGSTLTT